MVDETTTSGREAATFDFSATMDTTGFARMTVLDLAGNPAIDADGNEVWIEFDGHDSATFQIAQREAVNRRVRTSPGGVLPLEAAIEEGIHILARCTRAWSPNVGLDGRLLPCTYENAKLIYTRIPHVRDQADRFVRNRVNFTPRR